MTLGVDVGGTFTDIVRWDHGRLVVGKIPTTPEQSEGIRDGIAATAGPAAPLLHGSTVATNALLERRGARTAWVTDPGFADLIEIGRQDRPSLYDSFADRTEPLVARQLRFEVDPDDGVSLATLFDRLTAAQPDVIAVGLLHSYADQARERRLLDWLRRRFDIPIVGSHEVVGEFREVERFTTTCINAYLVPIVSTYLDRLGARLADEQLTSSVEVMRSSGGLISVAAASRLPAAILLSGPAGGVVAATEAGRALGHAELISFDMGGTSTDVCRISGAPEVRYERQIDGFPCRMPSLAVHTVGAGGGSVGWVDAGGALRVGPRSAGADPGPACYGKGGVEPTVTDANLWLGRLDSSTPLGGRVVLDRNLAGDALTRVGLACGMSTDEVALGMIRIAEAHMVRAIRFVSIEQGADPRDAALVSFGGAGGLHATSLARALGMPSVVVPGHAGVLSALGLLLSPRRVDVAATLSIDRPTPADIDEVAEKLLDEAHEALGPSRDPEGPTREEVHLDMRYLGQSHETTVSYRPGEEFSEVIDRFHLAHGRENGFSDPSAPTQVVTIRCVVTGPPALQFEDLPAPEPDVEPERGHRAVVTVDGVVTARVLRRRGLAVGARIVGPAVIEDDDATTYLAPGEQSVVHPTGALEITW